MDGVSTGGGPQLRQDAPGTLPGAQNGPWVGWVRRDAPRERWREACRAATEEACWRELLRVRVPWQCGERTVTRAGERP